MIAVKAGPASRRRDRATKGTGISGERLSVERIKAVTLVGQTMERLLAPIEGGTLKPGDELPSISEMSEQFGVSKIVVREALKSLEAKGVIELKNAKRAKVLPVSNEPLVEYFHRAVHVEISSIADFMEIRQALEIQAAGLAAVRRTPEELEQIEGLLRDLKGSLPDVDLFVKRDTELHLLIARATHNAMIVHILSSIRDVIAEVSREGMSRRYDSRQLATVRTLHERIVERIAEADEEGARTAMREHFDAIVMSIGHTQK